MCTQYKDQSGIVAYEWIEMLENGRTSVTHAGHSGHPDTATTTRNEERTLELIRENRRINLRMLKER